MVGGPSVSALAVGPKDALTNTMARADNGTKYLPPIAIK